MQILLWLISHKALLVDKWLQKRGKDGAYTSTTMIYSHSTLLLLLHVHKYDLHVHRIADVITTIWIDLVVSLRAQFENLQGDSKSQELAQAQLISL